MQASSVANRSSHSHAWLYSLGILAIPPLSLGLIALYRGSALLGVGATAELLGCALFLRNREVWRPPACGTVILLYIMALGWLWFDTPAAHDPLTHAVRGLLLLTTIGLVISLDMIRTGMEPRRRAHQWCRQLLSRHRWPVEFNNYAELPEVHGLSKAIQEDTGPAIRLLDHPRLEIRIAVLSAMSSRPHWRPGESAAVVQVAKTAKDAAIRSAAVLALREIEDPIVISAITPLLRDPAPEVRAATMLSLLAGNESKWGFTRDAVRESLSNGNKSIEDVLYQVAGHLPAMAICNLTIWATEREPLASRSITALVQHYSVLLQTHDIPELPAELGRQIVDPHIPATLRVELAGLLRSLGFLTPELLDRMTDSDQLSAIRLLAAETMLELDPYNEEVLDVLRGLGRQSNREMILVIARLLQDRVGLDMGLPATNFEVNGKVATEAARRVLQWATTRGDAALTTTTPVLLAPSAPVGAGTPPGGQTNPAPTPRFKRSSSRFRWLSG